MFKFVSSIIGSVLGKKRALDVDEEEQQQVVEKKQRVDSPMVHRIRVSNLPDRDLPMVKKYFKGLGYNRFKKAPAWPYAFITVDVNMSISFTGSSDQKY
jgi:hypothetical protein